MSKYVITDLEMCKVLKENRAVFGKGSELIQIGAVLVNDDYEISDTFMTYVKPQYGEIDSFIEKLTGIHNDDVKDAPDSETAIKMFTEWIPEDAKIVSWSESDLSQIIAELDGKYIDNPKMEDLLDTWIDCQVTFAEKMENPYRNYKLSEALIIADIDFSDGEHDALVDARNTALLFIKMEKDKNFTLSPYMQSSSGDGMGRIRLKI